MGRVNICAFSNLPIENGDDVILMVVRARPASPNLPRNPFGLYEPVTPFVKARYDEDSGYDLEPDEDAKLNAYLKRVGIERTDEHYQLDFQIPRDHFLVAFRPSVIDFWTNGMVFQDFDAYGTDGFYKPLGQAFVDTRKRIDRAIEQTIKFQRMTGGKSQYGNSTHLAPEFRLGEGVNPPAVEGIKNVIDEQEVLTEVYIEHVVEDYYPILLMMTAFSFARKLLVPIGTFGPQFHQECEKRNLDAMIAFLSQEAAALRKSDEEEED